MYSFVNDQLIFLKFDESTTDNTRLLFSLFNMLFKK